MSIGVFFSGFSDVGYYSNNADQPECLIFRGVVFSRITKLGGYWPGKVLAHLPPR